MYPHFDGAFVNTSPTSIAGSLIYFPQHGVYCASAGRLNGITEEQVTAHNAAFDKANIEGLDKCQIGQMGMFYYKPTSQSFSSDILVKTFTGIEVGRASRVGQVKRSKKHRTYLMVRNEQNFVVFANTSDETCSVRKITKFEYETAKQNNRW